MYLMSIINYIVYNYIFSGSPTATGRYSQPISEELLDTIPIKHEILAMVMPEPYKKFVYEIPFEDLPTEMCNSYDWVESIIKWRFSIGK